MVHPLDRLRYHVSKGPHVAGKPVSATKTNMGAYSAIAILDGFYTDPLTPALILAASRWIRDHGLRGVLAGSGTTCAIQLADYADKHGDDAALERIEV